MEVRMTPFNQEGTQMYAGVMKVADILRTASVDVWRQEEGEDHGYQRAPETGRTGKVAQYLRGPKPLMPTSVLLSHRGTLDTSDVSDGTVDVTIPEGNLWIVDGQHRLYGFQRAITEFGLEQLNDYALPVVIVENPSIEDEANQFRVINETMKKVRTDLARRILALRVSSLGSTGRQEARMSGRLWEANAVEVMAVLTNDIDSPWHDRIQPPNVRKQPTHVIRELSFVTSLKPILNERPYRTWNTQRVGTTLVEYWKAWRSLVPDAFDNPNDYVLLKTPGVFSLHQLAFLILEVLKDRGISNPTAEDFHSILQDLGDYATETFWRRGNAEGAALAGSMKGFAILADAMEDQLSTAGHSVE